MATLVAWNLANSSIRAAGCIGGDDCSHNALATPNGSYHQTEWVQDFGYTGKAKIWCNPANGHGKAVTVTISPPGWADGSTVEKVAEPITIQGIVGPNGSDECFSINGTVHHKDLLGHYDGRISEVRLSPDWDPDDKVYICVEMYSTGPVGGSVFAQRFSFRVWLKRVLKDEYGEKDTINPNGTTEGHPVQEFEQVMERVS